jgi:hypothetical protein
MSLTVIQTLTYVQQGLAALGLSDMIVNCQFGQVKRQHLAPIVLLDSCCGRWANRPTKVSRSMDKVPPGGPVVNFT